MGRFTRPVEIAFPFRHRAVDGRPQVRPYGRLKCQAVLSERLSNLCDPDLTEAAQASQVALPYIGKVAQGPVAQLADE
jgi:hypothetical protein